MESHKTFIIFLSVIIVSVVTGSIIIAVTSNRCLQTDPTICRMLGKLRNESFERVAGSYSESTSKGVINAVWTVNKPNKQIVFSNGSEETLNIIISDKNLFVKDYSEKAWWKEPKESLRQYSVDLPFEPNEFIAGLKAELLADSTVYSNPKSVRCGSTTCIRYTVQRGSSETSNVFVDIDPKENKLTRYLEQTGEEERIFVIVYQKKEIILPDMTKSAKPGENIFLESAKSRPSQKKGFELDFVREFEQQRKKNE